MEKVYVKKQQLTLTVVHSAIHSVIYIP